MTTPLRLLATTFLFLAACASGPGRAIVEPAFTARVVPVPEARPVNANPFASLVEIEVTNRSNEPLTLQKIDVQSIGQGRYTVIPVSQNFNHTIAAKASAVFAVRVQVIAEETVSMAEEPIHLRGVLVFDSPAGGFRRSFMQRVNPSTMH